MAEEISAFLRAEIIAIEATYRAIGRFIHEFSVLD